LRSGERRDLIAELPVALDPAALLTLQSRVKAVHVADPILDYVQALIARTRERADLRLGLSPRAGLGLLRAAQAAACIAGREAVMPEDVQSVLPAVVGHRLERRDVPGVFGGAAVARELLESIAVPI